MKRGIFVLGWLLIAVGVLGFLGTLTFEIPDDAQRVNDYSYIQDIGNGQRRLTILARPLSNPLFSIQAPLADRRVGIHYNYPDSYFDNTITAESSETGVAEIIGYAEFDLRPFNISSLTSAELYFKAYSNKATPNDSVGIYLTENITGNVSWNYPLARGNLQQQVLVTSGSPTFQEFEINVTSATSTELGYDEIVTFGFYPASNNCMVQIVTNSSQIWPILTIDYTPESSSSGGSSGTPSSTLPPSSTFPPDNTVLDDPVEPEPDLLKWWPIIFVVVGLIMVAWASNGRFYR